MQRDALHFLSSSETDAPLAAVDRPFDRPFALFRILERDKLGLDAFRIKDKSLTNTDSIPAPDLLAEEDRVLETALE